MILAIWQSFRRLPSWVQAWVALILVPVNALSLLIAASPGGAVVAALAVGAMLLNMAVMLAERGFSKAMAWPHLALWTPLVVILAVRLADGEGPPALRGYLGLLLVVDLVSLTFDARDAVLWWRGDRAIA